MKNKVNIVVHSFVLVLTITLLISLGFAWYATNKQANVSGISATTSSEKLEVVKHSLFVSPELNEDGTIVTPYRDDSTIKSLTGLLTGDKFYYSITVDVKDEKDIDLRTLDVMSLSMDGGEWFTKPVDASLRHDASLVNELEEKYTLVTYSTSEDGTTEKNVVDYTLYQDKTDESKIYYVDEESGLHYIYVDEAGNRYNMNDVYSYRLMSTFVGDAYENRTDYASTPTLFRTGGTNQTLQTCLMVDGIEWNPRDGAITLTFEFTFDVPPALSPNIDINCVSGKDLSIRSILVRA